MIGLESGRGTSPILKQSTSRTWPGWWPGTVVSVSDPEKRGRVQVRVAQVYGSESEEEFIADRDLPWALPNWRTYSGTGEAWVPPVGSTVWVGFIAGDHADPIWQGGWATEDDAIPEHVSSYGPGPMTRVIKTENGHIFEMRWKPGQSEIRIQSENGVKLRLVDDPALGGPFAEVCTPALRRMRLDDTLQSATLATPTQLIELLDAASTINITTTPAGTINETGLLSNKTFTGAGIWAFLSLLVTAGAAMTFTSLGLMTITGAGLVLATTAGQIALGSVAGSKRKLVMENFITDIYNGHTHGGVTAGGGSTSGPSALGAAAHVTQSVLAD